MHNSVAKLETGWATYLKAALFLLPAVLLWTATAIFIAPKLQQICADAGGIPLPAFLNTVLLFTDHGVLLLLGLVIPIALLEWFSEGWTRYRRLVTGFLVFVLNSVVLTSFFTMLLTFAVVAPALVNIGR